MREIQITVNDRSCSGYVEDRTSLAEFLRDTLGLTGTRLGCEQGVCGACTVILDRRPVRGCLVLAVQAEGRDVRTIEGMAPDADNLAPLQQAFRDAHGLQCGFCTAGMLLTAQSLLDEDPEPDEATIRDWMHGNLCRCTGYAQIVEAVQAASGETGDPA